MCPPCPPSSSRPTGFSLLELMVTLSIAGILLGLAAPSFRGMMLDSERASVVNSFVHNVYLARSTATLQGHTVSICRSIDGETCSNATANWQEGWIVFVNSDRDEPPMRDENERILAVQAPWRGGTVTSNRRSYSFNPYQYGVNGTLVFCDGRGPAQARAIIINIFGRPRLATRDAENRPLRCPNG
ncbi:GspH/FimT family pseudopilin [Peristeroidobacter agariperforans]|uniref:GspH/FimT family pseudopilin n=1 Tax=Peristeroidobacter agariperforans TaxID=268404 RepID=UPI00101CF3D2|nr:GspH/FimT family pseudopilin [Peristeroidobacter agariperforans]